jgi:hypothetical protein
MANKSYAKLTQTIGLYQFGCRSLIIFSDLLGALQIRVGKNHVFSKKQKKPVSRVFRGFFAQNSILNI